MVFDWPSPFGNHLPYVPVYYKVPMEGSVERGLGLLLEGAQETTNNSYRAKNDAIRKNAINWSVTVVEWKGKIKKNGIEIVWELELNKDDVIQISEGMKLSNFPVAKVNQDNWQVSSDANEQWDYISNLSNVTWWHSTKVSRVSGEVVGKTQVTQREIEPIIVWIEWFVTEVTWIFLQHLQLNVDKEFKVHIWWEDFDINIDDLKWRYTRTWSTNRIAELYRAHNAEKKEAALSLLMEIAPELVNRHEWAKATQELWCLDDKIIMSPADAQKFRIKQERDVIELQMELLEDQLKLEQKRAELFPQPPAWQAEEPNSLRTNVNINMKDIPNWLVRQEILAEAGAQSALEVDPMTLVSSEWKEALEKEVWFIETTQWVGTPWTPWVLVDSSTPVNPRQIIDLAENV